MQRFSRISETKAIDAGCVLTIGNFDGVHRGHQQILEIAREAADRRGTKLLAMTFEPHPLAIVRPERAPGTLTPLPLKEHLIGKFGADYLFVATSTPELLSLSAEEFIRRFLIEAVRPSLVVEGENFNFGSGRSGSVHTLDEYARENDFDVSTVEAKRVELFSGQSVEVSSTIIRNLLAEGSVVDAATTLGRPYRLMEQIIAGRGKGKRLGFPTANMRLPNQLIPAEGVYAGYALIADSLDELIGNGKRIPAALSIGTSATYGDTETLLIETHLFEENVGDLYGKQMAMDFIERIRPQKKFASESALAHQIGEDCENVRRVLSISS
ncbi:MAG: bifunctional riboflavin kinase/FAD synthetase [Planctomycetota bacterium]|jgi:riboflavin kinase/FMN adenylyltransferase